MALLSDDEKIRISQISKEAKYKNNSGKPKLRYSLDDLHFFTETQIERSEKMLE